VTGRGSQPNRERERKNENANSRKTLTNVNAARVGGLGDEEYGLETVNFRHGKNLFGWKTSKKHIIRGKK